MYMLTTDNDCHWYVIPEAQGDHWQAWCNLSCETEEECDVAWTVPSYAVEVGGNPTRVRFPTFLVL